MTAQIEIPKILEDLVSRWSQKYPKLASRIEAGRQIVLKGKISPFDATTYRAVGSKGETYTVQVRHGYVSCSCRDHQDRHVRCKHAWAASLQTRLAQKIEEALCPTSDHNTVNQFTVKLSNNLELSSR